MNNVITVPVHLDLETRERKLAIGKTWEEILYKGLESYESEIDSDHNTEDTAKSTPIPVTA